MPASLSPRPAVYNGRQRFAEKFYVDRDAVRTALERRASFNLSLVAKNPQASGVLAALGGAPRQPAPRRVPIDLDPLEIALTSHDPEWESYLDLRDGEVHVDDVRLRERLQDALRGRGAFGPYEDLKLKD